MTGESVFLLAYVDPGAGSLLLQMLLAGVVGGIVFFRTQMFSLVSWIKRKTLVFRQ